MDISIFGLGYVGCVSLGCLAKTGYNVIGVDINTIKVNQINSGNPTIIENDIDKIIREERRRGRISATTDYKEAILNTGLSIIAVGTPTTAHGHLEMNYIFNVARDFGEALRLKNDFHIIAIRSTIMPGTCKKFAEIIEVETGKRRNKDFAIIANPEFIREGTAVYDYYNPPLTLIGADNNKACKEIAALYKNLPAEIIITDIEVAEIMKYINNTFHALKISFANEVMEILIRDKHLNISPYYLKPGFAYGGSCLPKDLKGLQALAHDNYVKVPVIESIDKTNTIQIERAVDCLSQFKDKKIGFLGLSFKAGTDDLRNSPSVALIETLLGKGYNIGIFDKNVQLSRLTGTNKEYIESRIPHLARLMVNDYKKLISDSDILVITNEEKEFAEILRPHNDKKIVDLAGMPDFIRNKSGYYGINW
jgi:GDP-mannose 6-dehydrogenase